MYSRSTMNADWAKPGEVVSSFESWRHSSRLTAKDRLHIVVFAEVRVNRRFWRRTSRDPGPAFLVLTSRSTARWAI